MSKKLLYIIMLSVFATLSLSCDGETDVSTEKLGDSCDSNKYIPNCQGTQIWHCSKNIITAIDCDGLCIAFPSELTCSDNSEQCITDKIYETQNRISCMSDEDKSTTKDEKIQRCEKANSGSTYIRTYQCAQPENTDQLYYKRIESQSCYGGYGTCSESNECSEPVYCADNYVDHCKDNVMSLCNKNRLKEADCSAYSTPHQCKMVDATPDCLDDEDKCTVEGEEVVTHCNDKTNKESVKRCTATDDGSLYYMSASARNCPKGCNEEGTACAASSCDTLNATMTKCRETSSTTYQDIFVCKEVNGQKIWELKESEKCDDGKGTCSSDGACVPAESCTTSEFDSRCENNIALTCSAKKVKHERCDLYSTPRTCDVVDGKADCFDEDALCTTEGEEIVSSCNQTTKKEMLKICTKSASGKLYYVSGGTRECPKGCNAKGTACAD